MQSIQNQIIPLKVKICGLSFLSQQDTTHALALDSPTSTHERGGINAGDFVYHHPHYVDEGAPTGAEESGVSSQSHYLGGGTAGSGGHHEDFIYSDYSRIQHHAVRDIWAAAATHETPHHHHHHQQDSQQCDTTPYNNLRSKSIFAPSLMKRAANKFHFNFNFAL